MKPFWSILTFIFFFTVVTELRAETKSRLFLRAIVSNKIGTRVSELPLGNNKSLWLLTTHMNSLYPEEGQKFEVTGLNQKEMDAQVKKVMANDRTIQHEILISRLKFSMKNNKVIFLKISAN